MTSVGKNWTCPYCQRAQVLAEERFYQAAHPVKVEGSKFKSPEFFVGAIVCADEACKQLTLSAAFTQITSNGRTHFRTQVKRWSLWPQSNAKPQPDCIPEPLRADYQEACAIWELSPKAAATIIRRCLQGMIRDFCGIKKHRLIDEIAELRRLLDAGEAPRGVHHDTVDAIDHVRSIGNIGAHMEKDINVIVDVDPDEAQRLIELTELLFEEWYVARAKRHERLIKIGAIAAEKQSAKKPRANAAESAPAATKNDG